MAANRNDKGGAKQPTTRQKAGRILPAEAEGRGRLGKREVRAPRIDPKQRGGDKQRRRSGL